MKRIGTVVFSLGLVAACGGSATEPPLDDAGRRLLYGRADGIFEAAVLLRPSPATEEQPGFHLAPLLMQEVEPDGFADSPAPIPVVYLYSGSVEVDGKSHAQRTYMWAAGDARSAQGFRMTLGDDGFPAIYEILTDASGARLIFVTQALESAAAGELGFPLEGRRFAIERAADELPEVVVAGVLEPGPTPLGPFVYLTRGPGDVATVICRCMESRVENVLDSLEYELRPIDDLAETGLVLPSWLEQVPSPIPLLRLPAAGF